MIETINLFGNYILKVKYQFDWPTLQHKLDDIFKQDITNCHPEVEEGNSTLMSRIQ